MLRIGLALAALLLAAPAFAHHPGSHATRQAEGRVMVEAVAMANDACTRIASVRSGAPPRVAPVPGSAPVTVQLERAGAGPCAAAVTAVRAEAALDLPRDARQILLYILAPDGSVVATERVPVR
jgi:hypothetical protein